MSHLTKAIRQNMLKAVLDHAFADRQKEAEAALQAAGDAVYGAYYGENAKIMASLPPSYFKRRHYLSISIGGQRMSAELSDYKPVCFESYSAYIHIDADNETAISYLKADAKKEDIKTQRQKMSDEVNTILESVRTFKKLWEVWPESKPLLEKFEEKPPAAYLPAIQFDQINAALGLSPVGNK